MKTKAYNYRAECRFTVLADTEAEALTVALDWMECECDEAKVESTGVDREWDFRCKTTGTVYADSTSEAVDRIRESTYPSGVDVDQVDITSEMEAAAADEDDRSPWDGRDD